MNLPRTPSVPVARFGRGLPTALIACMLHLPAPAVAQTQLPGIVVVTPSPVVRPQPAPAAPQPAPPQASPPPAAAPPSIPGSLVVADDGFASLTVVTERDIVSQPGATVTDALQTRPGILGSTFAPGANRPILRGLDAYRVRVQENGIGTHDVSALSPDHAVPIDPFAAERVEVIRGPATLRYGSQAIGGVVAAENNRIPTFIPKNGFSGEIKGGWSSVDDGRDGAFQATAGSGNIALHADAFRRRTFDYDTPQGRQLNSFVDSRGMSLGGSYIWADGFFGIAYSRFESLYGIPGAEAAEHRPRIDLVQDKVFAKGEWRVRDYGIEAIRVWLGASRYSHDEIVFEAADARDIVGTRFTNREAEARVEVQHRPVGTALGELSGAAGVHSSQKRVAGFAVEEPVDGLIDPAAQQRYLAGFLFEELQVTQRLRLQAAGRIETNRAEGTAVGDPSVPTDPALFTRSFTPVSASVGALYELPLGVVARLTAQHTERAPDVGELFSKGVHEATGTFELGNPHLGIERANTAEIGVKRSKGALRFDASIYRTHYRGFIFKNFTGVTCDGTLASCGAGTELDQAVYAQRDAMFTGAEVAAQLDVGSLGRGTWGVEGQYDFTRAVFSDGINVPRIPPHRAGAGLFWRDTAWRARLFMLHAFRQDVVSVIDPKDTATNGYTMVNAELAYTWRTTEGPGLAQEATVGIRGDNLLDDDVRNHVSVKKDEVLQPGRTIRLFGSVKFN